MIPKIMKSAGIMGHVLDYNEDKVSEGIADRVAVHGFDVPDPDERAIRKFFKKREAANIRTKNVSFHLTINPGEDDAPLGEDVLKEVVRRTMEALGYGDQPWIIYRHRDIDREHYHVVSTSIRPDGTRVPGSMERMKLMALYREMGKEYGFQVGRKKRSERARMQRDESPVPVFRRKSRNTAGNIAAAFEHALTYRFATHEQFEAVLLAHGVKTIVLPPAKPGGEHRYAFRGTDYAGNPVTPMVLEEEVLPGAYARCSAALGNAPSRDPGETRLDRKELAGTVGWALDNATSEDHFRALCARQGIGVVLHRSADDEKKIYGMTVIDHLGLGVWKSSDIDRTLSGRLKEASEERWPPVKEVPQKAAEEAAERIYESFGITSGNGAGPKGGTDIDSVIRFGRRAAGALLSAVISGLYVPRTRSFNRYHTKKR